jgi:hypothetical protein
MVSYILRAPCKYEGTIAVDSLDANALTDYAGICGLLLAKGHARTSGASMIAGYVARRTSSTSRCAGSPAPTPIRPSATGRAWRGGRAWGASVGSDDLSAGGAGATHLTREPAGDPQRGTDEALRRSAGPRGPRPGRRAGRSVRLSGSQRRRQDDDHPAAARLPAAHPWPVGCAGRLGRGSRGQAPHRIPASRLPGRGATPPPI